MTRMIVRVVFVLVLWPVWASAQQGIAFTPSSNHDTAVDSYTFVVSGPTPRSQNIGKPTPVENEITVLMPAFFDGLAAGNYSAIVRADGPGGTASSAPTGFSVAGDVEPPTAPGAPIIIVDSTQPPPNEWDARAIGSGTGDAAFTGSQLVIHSNGSDTWGTADSFFFVSQETSTDGEIITRVDSLTNTHPHAKAGLMWRETFAAGSRSVQVNVEPNGNIEFMARQTTGGNVMWITGATQAFPVWLRLVRTGSTIAAYRSTNGSTWIGIGSTPTALATSSRVGAFALSHAAATTTAVFGALMRP